MSMNEADRTRKKNTNIIRSIISFGKTNPNSPINSKELRKSKLCQLVSFPAGATEAERFLVLMDH